MSGCLYFPEKLGDVKGHLQKYIISCKIFFQIKDISQRKHELIANPLILK